MELISDKTGDLRNWRAYWGLRIYIKHAPWLSSCMEPQHVTSFGDHCRCLVNPPYRLTR